MKAKKGKSSFDQILDYIKLNFNQEIFLSDLSEKFFYQTTYICYLFKKAPEHYFFRVPEKYKA